MDGQEPDRPAGRAKAPDEAELKRLRGFLGSATGPGSHGVYKSTGERPDNVRRLQKPTPKREID
ncbi:MULTISPECIES: hypothetical protein [Kribbella]|jgi:hypothetical protein|uniref:Uncharacterized protein n=1 Tax=Kribbella karoonensis TaxID=324851 RepID=A0ABN2DR38_9ACTN